MKKLILLFAILFSTASFGQCVDKCINSSATATVTLDPTWTYTWTVSGGIAFTGQGTNTISIASVGATVGQVNISVLITTQYCDSTITGCLNVIDVTPTHVDESVCASNGTGTFAAGSPAGGTITDSGGATVTTFDSNNIGDTFTYTVTSGGCVGSSTFTINGVPMPNATLIIN
jgi:hypothetical protein